MQRTYNFIKKETKQIMKMDKIEMSLDDIIKSNKKRPSNNLRTTRNKPGQFKRNNSPTKKFGGVVKGRGGRGGITRVNKYTRVS